MASGSVPLTLPAIIGDGMVVQREEPLRLWGRSAPGSLVEARIGGARAEARAGPDGRWSLRGPELAPGGPYAIEIESGTELLVLREVLAGEVWLCSGQSNAVLPIERVRDRYEDFIAANLGRPLRRFRVPDRFLFEAEAEDSPGGSWQEAKPEAIGDFSALAWFFACRLNEELGLPVGIVCAAVGGSPIHAFLPESALGPFPAALGELRRCRAPGYVQDTQAADRLRISAWSADLDSRDPGLGEGAWQSEGLDDSLWDPVDLHSSWEECAIGPGDGSAWYRKSVDLPPSLAGRAGRLMLGTLIDADTSWVNGAWVGSTSYRYPPRRYPIPPGLLREGRNTIAFRLVSSTGLGGCVPGKPCELRMQREKGESIIDLSKGWRGKRAAFAPQLAEESFFTRKPSALFNGMIAPVLGFGYRGAIWYQGESDTGSPEGYADKLEALVTQWRARSAQPGLPFLIVQLPLCERPSPYQQESGWAAIREAQRQCAGKLAGATLAVALDLGEWNDLHPENKADLALRLSLLARREVYGGQVPAGGPRLISARRRAAAGKGAAPGTSGAEIVLEFEEEGRGLTTLDGGASEGPLPFFVAGSDGVFRAAASRIEGNLVLLGPIAAAGSFRVRYAWADNPAGRLLADSRLWPASPFEADCRS
jgi:sialate O-acetylesterase